LGDAVVFLESVVRRNLRMALGTILALLMSFATVFSQHGTPWKDSSA
jgi:hypothetical protein